MKNPKRYTVPYRRKREMKTDYKKRVAYLKSGRNRLVIRKSLKNILGSIVAFDAKGDKIIASVSSKELSKMGWSFSNNNMSASYLTGYMLGVKAAAKNVSDAILDLGLQSTPKGGKLYAFLKGVLDGGITVPHDDTILPSEERIKGAHIANYAKELKSKDEAAFKKQFSGYAKTSINPDNITSQFEELKNKIKGAK